MTYAVIIDVDGCASPLLVTVKDVSFAAPGKKLRIRFDRIDEGVHLLRSMLDEDRFLHLRQLNTPLQRFTRLVE